MEQQTEPRIETKQMQETKDRVRELYYALLDFIYKCMDYDRDFSSDAIFDELSEEEYLDYQEEAKADMEDSLLSLIRLQEYSQLDLPKSFDNDLNDLLLKELRFLPEDIVMQQEIFDRPDAQDPDEGPDYQEEDVRFLDGGYKKELQRIFKDYYLS